METQKRQIGKYEYRAQALPAWQGLDATHRLLSLVGPALEPLAVVKEGKEMTVGMIGGMVAGALKGLPPEKMKPTIELLLSNVSVMDGEHLRPVMQGFDLHFQGRMLDLFKVVAFSVEVNFADFFEAARPVLNRAAATLKKSLATELAPSPPSA